jgi:hypothetical protein
MELADFIVSSSLLVLIWLIQILHYPFFVFVDDQKFLEAMLFHQNRITLIVMPLMAAELLISITKILLFFNFWNMFIFCIVLSLWVCTFFIQVPLHNILLKEYDVYLIKKLVQTNWIRTFLWSLKFLILLIRYDY